MFDTHTHRTLFIALQIEANTFPIRNFGEERMPAKFYSVPLSSASSLNKLSEHFEVCDTSKSFRGALFKCSGILWNPKVVATNSGSAHTIGSSHEANTPSEFSRFESAQTLEVFSGGNVSQT